MLRRNNLNKKEIKIVYSISDENGNKIFVEKNQNGRLNLKTGFGQDDFVFIGSKPEMVKRIAKLILEASEV